MKFLFLVFLATLLGGCATFGTMQTAETVGRGRVQMGLEPSVWQVGVEGAGSLALPSVGVSARVGITDTVDIGGRIGSSGPEVMAKVQVTDPERTDLAVSVAPSVAAFGIGVSGVSTTYVAVQVPVLVGLAVGPHQVVLGPKVHVSSSFARVSDSTASAQLVGIGSSFGFAARLGPRITLLPEVALVKPVYVSGSIDGSTGDLLGGTGIDVLYSQFSLGVLIDFGE
jgi:hypothetical protein